MNLLAKTKKTKKLIHRISPEVVAQFKAGCALRQVTMSSVMERLLLKQIEDWSTLVKRK